MYFLAKNIRTCSKSFRGTPDRCRLYKNGVLNWEYLAKNISYFVTHPEQIRQKLKEKDANMLCQFFDSEEYKKRVSQFLETQGRILSQDTISGIKPPGYIKYQHVLSCAQPTLRKPKTFVEYEEEAEAVEEEIPKRRRPKRGTVFEEVLKRKGQMEIMREAEIAAAKQEVKTKRVRQRSTIMPIFLKKIKERQREDEEESHEYKDEESPELHYQTARKVEKSPNAEEPLYAQILYRSNVYKNSPRRQVGKQTSSPNIPVGLVHADLARPSTATRLESGSSNNSYRRMTTEQPKIESRRQNMNKMNPLKETACQLSSQRTVLEMVEPSSSKANSISNKTSDYKQSYRLKKDVTVKLSGPSRTVPLRMASSTAKMTPKGLTTKLYPRKNMNLKSFSEFLCVEPIHPRRFHKIDKNPKEKLTRDLKIEVLDSSKQQKMGSKAVKRKTSSLQMLMEQVQRSRSLQSLRPNNSLENRNTLMQIVRNREEKKSRVNTTARDMTSLFKKVKMGTSKKVSSDAEKPIEIKPTNLLEVIHKSKLAEPQTEPKSRINKEQESFTYKIVTKTRERREAKLRQKFKMNPPYWQRGFTLAKPEENLTKEVKDLEEASTKNNVMNFADTRQRLGALTKNIPTNLHRYLIRLPKTTPEGYRVLLYSVRDPDPTKMNFSDVVKGFCMYNDCVLSEDGLQEGYIVIFDMRDVSIGHLARVSLPALKCFMYYIQDAHPCRLKQIHVLNTATWIHHVMRLVVPLVRSELLNLVKFHKGRVPDGFPVELLPMDYGGEAPTVEELDTTTKSLLDKYREWLVESEHFKADESKRIKKGGWFGFFSSKTTEQEELDEKTILKNLQID